MSQQTKLLRDMNNDEAAAWAEAERIARIADLEDRSPGGLLRAQENAERRRRTIGATRSQVAALIAEAGRIKRRAEFVAAFAKATGSAS